MKLLMYIILSSIALAIVLWLNGREKAKVFIELCVERFRDSAGCETALDDYYKCARLCSRYGLQDFIDIKKLHRIAGDSFERHISRTEMKYLGVNRSELLGSIVGRLRRKLNLFRAQPPLRPGIPFFGVAS